MTDTAALESRLSELLALRQSGELRVKYRDREVEYPQRRGLASAIANLERRIAEGRGSRVRTVRFSTSKGSEMRNFVQPGLNVTVIASGGVSSGDGVLIGSLFGVATGDAAGAPRSSSPRSASARPRSQPASPCLPGSGLFRRDRKGDHVRRGRQHACGRRARRCRHVRRPRARALERRVRRGLRCRSGRSRLLSAPCNRIRRGMSTGAPRVCNSMSAPQ